MEENDYLLGNIKIRQGVKVGLMFYLYTWDLKIDSRVVKL